MSTFMNALAVRAALGTILVFITAAPAFSQTTAGRAKEGGYASFTLMPKFTFDGETFDGLTVYQEEGGDELGFLPKLDEQNLFKFGLGHRWRQGALEVSYERSQHDGNFADEFELDTIFQAVNIDAKMFFLPDSIVQPYISAGGSYPWLTIKDGSAVDESLEELGDSRWRGWGVNAEAGVAIYPHSQFGILAGYAYKAIWFDRASGVSDRLFDLRPRFRETSHGFAISAAFTF
jgi:hypothetical protein